MLHFVHSYTGKSDSIFFASIILGSIAYHSRKEHLTHKQQAIAGLKAALFGSSLLALVYAGINYLSAYHGQGISYENAGELFREISFRVLNHHGALIISIAVFMACYSTAITLGAVIGSYLQHELFHNKIGFMPALILVLAACIPLCTTGLNTVGALTSGPLTYIGYPAIITLTFCNLAYKLWNFKPVKIPVLITFVAMLLAYIIQYL